MTAPSTLTGAKVRRGWLSRLRVWPVRCAVLALLVTVLLLGWPPVRVQYHVQRGQADLADHRPGNARAQFLRAERLDPRRAETQFWLARTSRKLGDLEEVRRRLDRAQELGYDDPERLRREWWLVLAEMGQVHEVEQRLPDMLMSPGDDGAEICDAFTRGYCLRLEFDQALPLLEAWQRDHPDDFRPHLQRGRIHAGRSQWTDAEAAFRQALSRAPGDPTAQRELGVVLFEQRRLEEAAQYLKGAIQGDPADTKAYLTLARVLRELEQDGVADLLRQALALDPHNDAAVLLLADVVASDGDAEEAVRLLTPLVETWPEDLAARFELAQALRAAGRADEGETHFRVYAELERKRARIEELNRIVRRDPQDTAARFELGELLLRHESRAEGVVWLKSVFLYDPDHAGAHGVLSEYYSKVGAVDLADRHRRLSSSLVNSPAAGQNPAIHAVPAGESSP